MIKRLQKRFIIVSGISLISVFLLIFIVAYILNTTSVNRTMDTLTDTLSKNEGRFPDAFPDNVPPGGNPSFQRPSSGAPNFFSKETPFSTRFFVVSFNEQGEITSVNTSSIQSVTEEQAIAYARTVVNDGDERGWKSNYRYKLYLTDEGYSVVFVDGSINRAMSNNFLYIIGVILLVTTGVVILLTVLLSRRAMKPIADGYEKQKQFITDANHELKTPLSLILTNLDILESEIGENQWVDGIRLKGEQMAELIGQLMTLSRMDENRQTAVFSNFVLSEAALDVIAEFQLLANERKKNMTSDIHPDLICKGDEGGIRKLISILLDNAIKYCDEGGDIHICIKKKRNIMITVENTYRAVDKVELDKLFDRFYRADKARTSGNGFGIGLSIAKSITKQHGGDIIAYQKDDMHIGFRATLKD